MNTNEFFKPGKLSIVMDGTFGSSGKGCVASFITEHANNWQFACNAFSAQAGHWVRLDDGRSLFYQTLNSCAYQDKCERILIGPDAAIELSAIFREIDESRVTRNKIGIHPLATVIQEKDMAYERGEVDFDGKPYAMLADGTKKNGSTCHGTGPARVRKMLRRSDTLLARDVPELKEFVCDTSSEIMFRLDRGEAGLLEIAQGYPLSLNSKFYPACTNRNVTVSAALDGMMLPPIYAGNVLLNYRTYPIRISSFKYIGENGKFLTWSEVQEYNRTNKKYEVYEGNSGGWYQDQKESTWEEITELSGSPTPIMELTSVTKLPRRVATFSRELMSESIKYNRTNGQIFISINFMNYVDHDITGLRTCNLDARWAKCTKWIDDNIKSIIDETGAKLWLLGTGPLTDDKIVL